MSSTQPVRIRLRFASFDALIDKFAPNITRGGVFIASRTPLPIGSTFAFEIQLAGGEVALAGDGKVTWVKAFDPAAPQKPHGMGVQFLRLDNPSRELLNKILARKAARRPRPGATARAPMAMGGSGAYRIGTNGTAQPKIDTSVDLASEFGVDEARLRRAGGSQLARREQGGGRGRRAREPAQARAGRTGVDRPGAGRAAPAAVR